MLKRSGNITGSILTFAKTKSLSKNKFKATWGVTMSKHRIKCKRRNPCQNFKSVAGHYSEKKLHDMSILCPKNWRQDGGLTCMSTNPCEWPFDRRMLMTFNVRLDLTFASTTALKRNVWWDVVIFMYFLRRNMRNFGEILLSQKPLVGWHPKMEFGELCIILKLNVMKSDKYERSEFKTYGCIKLCGT